jgi:hypothetical protein
MNSCPRLWLSLVFVMVSCPAPAAQTPAASGTNPAETLPPHITRLTWFGERADFSLDGQRVLFVEKTYGDAYEVELATRIIRPVTHHFYHGGFTRALYLANGDILLSGCRSFDAEKPHLNRTEKAELWVLDKSLARPPHPLGTKCSEGPAVSRRRLHLAWTHVASQYPTEMKKGSSRILEADLVYEAGLPKLVRQRVALESTELPFACTLETQNYVPPDENRLTFSAYGYQGTDVCLLDLRTKQVKNLTDSPADYDEPEGIFPDGQFTLVECDRQNKKGWRFIDIWKLRLDGGGYAQRLTRFSDHPGFKASNPVVSDDGRFMAFQMAKTTDEAGVGYGIFLYDLARAGQP